MDALVKSASAFCFYVSVVLYGDDDFVHPSSGGLIAIHRIIVVSVLCHLAEMEVTTTVEVHGTVFACV